MKTRKIVLLASVAALAVVWTIQLVMGARDPVRRVQLETEPDTIRVERNGELVYSLHKQGELWTIGEQAYQADASKVQPMLDLIKDIKVLQTLNTSDYTRYGLDEAASLVVSAWLDGKEQRVLRIGKESSTSQQTWAQLDASKSVRLVAQNLARVFEQSIDDLRRKDIYAISSEELTRVELSGTHTWAMQRTGDSAEWSLVDSDAQLDADKVNSWISAIVSMRAVRFADENQNLPAEALGTITLQAGPRSVQVAVLKDVGDGEYLCRSSETPWPFIASSWVAERLLKPLDELIR